MNSSDVLALEDISIALTRALDPGCMEFCGAKEAESVQLAPGKIVEQLLAAVKSGDV